MIWRCLFSIWIYTCWPIYKSWSPCSPGEETSMNNNWFVYSVNRPTTPAVRNTEVKESVLLACSKNNSAVCPRCTWAWSTLLEITDLMNTRGKKTNKSINQSTNKQTILQTTVDIYVWMYVWIYVCMDVWMDVWMDCMYVCMYVYMYVCINNFPCSLTIFLAYNY